MKDETIQCRIFRDPKRNKLINPDLESNIISLGTYYPKHGRPYKDMDKFSSMILDIKKDERKLDKKSFEYYYHKKAITYFTNQLRDILSNTEEYVICVMPTHAIGTAPSGIRTIARQLSSPPIVDGTDVLSRVFEIAKKAMGGSRDLQLEIKSLTVINESAVKGRQVLLLDDVVTTGTSLKAGKYLIERAGAKMVVLLALAKTQRE
ncbi:MAG: phosphoribosyltransferase family protein [Euryarchaeota archaeon]|nr:phosphoribosyltransferase family protein [Euryarchaeota archaeon]